jgi:hypothetical protein
VGHFHSHFSAASYVSAGLAAVAIDGEVAQQWRSFSGDQIADQTRGEKTECDPVAAIAVGRIDTLGAGDRPDQG